MNDWILHIPDSCLYLVSSVSKMAMPFHPLLVTVDFRGQYTVNWFNFQLGTLHQVTMGHGSGSTSMMRCITGCCAPCTASCRDARYAHGSAAIGRRAGRLKATQRRLGLQSKKILPWMRHDILYYRILLHNITIIFTIYYYIDLYITMHKMIL